MKLRKTLSVIAVAAVATLSAACGGTGSSGSGDGTTLTVYSADGLAGWYEPTFKKFTDETGINVNLVEAGSGEVVSRVEKEQSNPQADLLVTLPPFIQRAAQSNLLQPSGADTSGIAEDQVGPDGTFVPIVDNALSFIVNPGANPPPVRWDDLLKPEFKGKLQYSTPGQAGDGTAVLVLLQHLRGKPGALEYLKALQANNVGPSSSTGPDGTFVPIVDNALSFIVNPGANPPPVRWDDLLKPEFKGKLQYSTPGQAGDGTAVLVLLQHLRGKPGALEYLKALQANNVGPSSSTGKLQPKVSNGELLVANGDVQMNLASIKDDGSTFEIFIPAGADGKRTSISLPYVAGVTAGAPHAEDAKKLLAFLISEDIQKTVEPDALGIPVLESLKGSGSTEPNTPMAVLDGVDVWVPDWDAVLADLDADLAEYQKATGS